MFNRLLIIMIADGAGVFSVDENQTISSEHQVNPIVRNNFKYVINLLKRIEMILIYIYIYIYSTSIINITIPRYGFNLSCLPIFVAVEFG